MKGDDDENDEAIVAAPSGEPAKLRGGCLLTIVLSVVAIALYAYFTKG